MPPRPPQGGNYYNPPPREVLCEPVQQRQQQVRIQWAQRHVHGLRSLEHADSFLLIFQMSKQLYPPHAALPMRIGKREE